MKKWIGGILLLIAVVTITPWLVGWKMDQVVNSMKTTVTPQESLFKDLQLSADQQQKIKDLEKDYEQETTKSCGLHCSARSKIAQHLASGKVESTTLMQIEQEVSKAYSDSERATLRHVLQISEVLTPDQRIRFLKRYGERVQATCPMEFVR